MHPDAPNSIEEMDVSPTPAGEGLREEGLIETEVNGLGVND